MSYNIEILLIDMVGSVSWHIHQAAATGDIWKIERQDTRDWL